MLLKQYKIITVIVAVGMFPVWAFAANKFVPAAAAVGADNTVVIPLVVTNDDGVSAIDIPLTFSEGVTLKEVTFENTRVEHFDLKLSNIKNEQHTVVIGLINQVGATLREPLSAGEGPVANLVFEVNDPSVTEIRLAENESLKGHDLVYVYNTRSNPGQIAFDEVHPDFPGVSVALSGVAGSLPTEYALDQNYPNPFNPTTEIGLALPVTTEVELSVFNVLGQKVTTLVQGEMTAGYHTITWNGTNSDGSSVASGIYFYRIVTDQFTTSKKMMLLK
jgi:methionine-rich copper-binding protein CopC